MNILDLEKQQEEEEYDIVIVGTKVRNNYVGSRTFYINEILKKYNPDLKVGIYDTLEELEKRIYPHNCKNLIFLPWSETIDENWIDFFIYTKGKKILYTETFDWYQKQKERILKFGFNLENIFNIIAFSTREKSEWWNQNQYSYWGAAVFNDFFKNLETKETKEKIIYVDTPWSIDNTPEPYNALRVFDECIPLIKQKHPDVKIICQNYDAKWVDKKIDKELDLQDIIEIYSKSDIFIVSHVESYGLPQIEAQMCGTKIITTNLMTNSVGLLSGNNNYCLWDFEKDNYEKDFMNSIENLLLGYDKNLVKSLSQSAWNDSFFYEKLKKDLNL